MNLSLVAGIAAGMHANVVPDPVIVPHYTLGPVGLGAVNLTARQLPPQKPNAILEQGVGRTPGITDWERQEHRIYDNADWYLGVGALFQPADESLSAHGGPGGGPGLRTQIPVPYRFALEYIQNREDQSTPGSFAQRTVQQRPAIPNTVAAILP